MPAIVCYGDSNTHGADPAPGCGGAAVIGRARRLGRAGLTVAALGAVALVIGGCISRSDVLSDRAWALVEVHGAPPVADAVLLLGSDGRLTVQTGCNTAGGTYRLDGDRILLDAVQQTMMLCEGELAAQEAGVLAVVKGSPTYSIDTRTGRLRLTSEAGQVLLFEGP